MDFFFKISKKNKAKIIRNKIDVAQKFLVDNDGINKIIKKQLQIINIIKIKMLLKKLL